MIVNKWKRAVALFLSLIFFMVGCAFAEADVQEGEGGESVENSTSSDVGSDDGSDQEESKDDSAKDDGGSCDSEVIPDHGENSSDGSNSSEDVPKDDITSGDHGSTEDDSSDPESGGNDETPVCEKHKFDYKNPVCKNCGYVCKHTNAEFVPHAFDWVSSEWEITDTTHTDIFIRNEIYECQDCRYEWPYDIKTPGTPEAHVFRKGEPEYVSRCMDCGYACKHGSVSTNLSSQIKGYEVGSEENHVVIYVDTTTEKCGTCYYEGSTTAERRVEEAHTFVDGACSVCGRPCGHPATQSSEAFEFLRYESKDQNEHYVVGNVVETKVCTVCGTVAETEVIEENAAYEESHSMTEGKCTACGYREQVKDETPSENKKPENKKPEKDSSKETVKEKTPQKKPLKPLRNPLETQPESVEDEAAFRQLAENETIHGVSILDRLSMVEVMRRAIGDIELICDADTFRIAFEDTLLTEAETNSKNEMDAFNRFVVLLFAIDLQDELKDMEISADAAIAGSRIRLRVSEMEDAERNSYWEMVNALFFEEQAETRRLVFTLTYAVGGVETCEVFGFENVENAWMFTASAIRENH